MSLFVLSISLRLRSSFDPEVINTPIYIILHLILVGIGPITDVVRMWHEQSQTLVPAGPINAAISDSACP